MGRVNRCIYCGAVGVPLSDEHIIPFGLGGPHILAKASCAGCATLTSRLEGRLLRGALLPYRAVRELPTRRPDDRPSRFVGEVKRGDMWVTEEFKVEKLVAGVAWPIYERPGVFDDVVTGPRVKAVKLQGVVMQGAVAGDGPKRTVRITGNAKPISFGRLIAKVGYGYAVAELGLDAFTPLVLGDILGDGAAIGTWVGCPDETGFDPPILSGHACQVSIGDDGFVRSYIRLFAEHGTPEYLVVVGRVEGSLPIRGRSGASFELPTQSLDATGDE